MPSNEQERFAMKQRMRGDANTLEWPEGWLDDVVQQTRVHQVT